MIFNAFCGKPLPKLTNPGSAGDLLTGKQLINANGEIITGSMPNQGAQNKMLNAGGSFTIPAGYHNGLGIVSANSLANQTAATAVASDIATGKTAWVNGQQITGTKQDPKMYVSKHAFNNNPIVLTGGTKFSIAIPSHYKLVSNDVRECMLCLTHRGYATYNNGSEEPYSQGAIPSDIWGESESARRITGSISLATSGYSGEEDFIVTISGNTITFELTSFSSVKFTSVVAMYISVLVYDA